MITASGDGRTLSISELRARLESAKARYAGNNPRAFDRTIDELIATARAQYGERIPVVDALRILATIQLPDGADGAVSRTPSSSSNDEKTPEGVTVEQRPAGFLLRASCRSFVTAGLWLIFTAVLVILPFRLWGDQLNDVFTEGAPNWMTDVLLAVWLGAVLYLVAMAVYALFGEIRITKSGDDAEIFTGIRSLGRTARLRWSDLSGPSNVEVAAYSSGRFSHTAHYIALNSCAGTFRFGSDLSGEQQAFVISFIRRQVTGIPHA